MEEIPAANVLHANLSPFQTDFESRKDQWYFGGAETQSSLYGTFLRKVDSGTAQSKQETSIKLPLSHLFGIGKMKQFSNKLFGDCKIHLEFEDDTSVVANLFQQYTDTNVYTGTSPTLSTIKIASPIQTVPNGNNVWNGMPVVVTSPSVVPGSISKAAAAVVAVPDGTGFEVGDTVTISGATANTGDETTAINSTFTITAVAGNNITINIDTSGFTGGQINVGAAKLVVHRNKTIKSSEFDKTNNTVTYTLDSALTNPWTADGAASFKAVANAAADSTLTYEINDVDIIAYQYLLGDSQINSLESKMKRGLNMEFLTYDLERINMPEVALNTQYDRQFDCGANTINAIMMTPQNGFLTSGSDNVKSFRWRVNGLETTNRDIVLGQSLYNDRLMSVLSSGSIKVKNLAPVSFLAGQSLAVSPERQVVQVRLNQGSVASNAKILYLYKQRRRVIKANSNSVEVV